MDITCLEKEYAMDDFVYQSKIKVHDKTKLIHFSFITVLKY